MRLSLHSSQLSDDKSIKQVDDMPDIVSHYQRLFLAFHMIIDEKIILVSCVEMPHLPSGQAMRRRHRLIQSECASVGIN